MRIKLIKFLCPTSSAYLNGVNNGEMISYDIDIPIMPQQEMTVFLDENHYEIIIDIVITARQDIRCYVKDQNVSNKEDIDKYFAIGWKKYFSNEIVKE